MRRIRNSIKALIVSLCVAVVAAGVILGVVLTNRGKKPYDPNIPELPTYNDSSTFESIAKDINKSKQPIQIDAFEEHPYINFCNNENLRRIGENYFSFIDNNNVEQFYTFGKNERGEYVYYNLIDFVAEKDGIDANEVNIVNLKDNYVSINSSYLSPDTNEDTNSFFDEYYDCVIYFGDNGKPYEIYSINTNNKTVLLDLITFGENYFIVSLANNYNINDYKCDISVEFYELTKSELNKNHLINKFEVKNFDFDSERIEIINNSIIYINNEKLKIININNNNNFICFEKNFKLNESGEVINAFEIYTLTSTKFLIEEKIISNVLENGSVLCEYDEYVKYNYSILELNNNQFDEKNINLNDGFAKLTTTKIADDATSYYLCQQKYIGHNLTNEYISQYYDANNKLLVQYESKENETIIYTKGINFLTNYRIIQVREGVEAKNFVLFSDYGDFVLSATGINSSVFTYTFNGKMGLIDINGRLVIDVINKNTNNSEEHEEVDFNEIYEPNEGYAIGKSIVNSVNNYYLIDLSTGEYTLINNFYEKNDILKLTTSGSGLYLIYESGKYSLYKNNSIIINNINSYKISCGLLNNTIIELYDDEDKILKHISLDLQTETSINEVDLYSNHLDRIINTFAFEKRNSTDILDENGTKIGYIEGWSGTANAHKKDWALYVYMNDGYFINYLYFKTEFWNKKNTYIKTRPDGIGTGKIQNNGSSIQDNNISFEFYSDENPKKYRLKGASSYHGHCDPQGGPFKLSYSNYIYTTTNSYGRLPYTISYIHNYNNNTSSETVYYGLETTLKTISRSGYTFNGWFTEKDGGSKVDKFYCEGSGITVYAHWTANTYNVSFNMDGGSPTKGDITVSFGDVFYVQQPTKLGYTFSGWELSNLSRGTIYYGKNDSVSKSKYISSFVNSTEIDSGYEYFKNLRTTSGTCYFKAKWTTNNYNIRYYFNTGGNSKNYTGWLINGNGTYQDRQLVSSSTGSFINKGSTTITTNSSGLYYYDFTNSISYKDNYNINVISIAKQKFNDSVTIFDSNNKFIEWICFSGSDHSTSNLKNVDKNYQLENYVNDNNLGDDGIINVYAVYELRDYYVSYTSNFLGGSVDLLSDLNFNNIPITGQYIYNKLQQDGIGYGSMLGENINIKNNNAVSVNINQNRVLYDYLIGKSIADGTGGVGTTSYMYNVGLGNSFQITFKLGKYTKESKEYNLSKYYTFNSITLYNMPYYTGSTFSYKDITINGNTSSNNVKPGDSYNGQDYNTYTVSFGVDGNGYEYVTILINNCYFAGSISGSNYTVDSSTVTSTTGTYGFNIGIDVISKQSENDSVNISSNPSGGNYSSYVVQPLYSAGGNYFIWLNGKKFQLDNNANKIYSNLQGYRVRVYNNMAYCSKNNIVGINANNTQILAMRPNQGNIKPVSSAVSVFSGGMSELQTYINSLVVGDISLTMTLARKINNYAYGDYEWIINGENIIKYSGNFVIPYGDSDLFKVLYCYNFTTKNRSFNLCLGQNSNNELMYFLISDSNITNNTSGEKANINISFVNLSKNINVNVDNQGDTYLDSDIGMNISYKQNSVFANGENGTILNYIKNGNVRTKSISMLPSQYTILKISPQDGYLIESIIVKLGGIELFNFAINNVNGLNYYNNSYFTYLGYGSTGQGNTATSLISYKFNKNNSFTAYNNSNNGNYGIYWSDYQNRNWGNSNSFESIYLLVSGAYHDVSIEIKTKSYVEFNFVDSNNILGYDGSNLTNIVIANINDEIIYGNANYSNAQVLRGNNNVYRIVFLGKATLFRNGVQLYASNTENSVEFLNGSIKYYNDKEGSAKAYLNDSIQSYNSDNITYLKFDNIKTFFERSDTFDENGRGNNDYIKAKKYLLSVECNKLSLNLTTNSYLFNSNPSGGGNNIVVERNINGSNLKFQLDNRYKTNSWFNGTVLSNIDIIRGSLSRTNWQTQLNGVIENIGGYGVYYIYKEIPGYYLRSIEISIGGERRIVEVKDIYGQGILLVNGIYIKIDYDVNLGVFNIYLYDNNDSVEGNKNSLNLLKFKDIEINLFSMAYGITINYNNSGSSSHISTFASFKNTQEEGYYDSLFTLASTPSKNMTGYTFVGWGSESYYNSSNIELSRYNDFDGGINLWNSSSSWFDVSGLFASSSRDNLLGLFKSGDNYSSDFYVAGGRFITDTGSIGTQNYNFWSAHADTFLGNIKKYGKVTNNQFKIDLYAIWKPNTYVVQLNFNDNNTNSSNWYSSTNGSTMASLGTSKIISPDSLALNYNFLSTTNNGYNITYTDGSITTYYAYVTFDTNNWYIVKDPSLAISYLNSNEINYRHNGLVDSNNLLNMIVDRYGYTWLGWFDSAFDANVASTATSCNNNNLIFGSTYTNNVLRSGVNILPTLNNARFNHFKSNGYFNDTVSTKFYYYNRNNTADGINLSNYGALKDGIYFYIYNATSRTGSRGYYLTNDYLNIYYGNTGASYFDTALSYNAYGSNKGNSIIFNKTNNTYRYITLFANWQINSYKLIVDFADDGSELYSNFGSSLVTNYNSEASSRFTSSMSFDFDSKALENFLNTFNPTRVGYDFLGWSFRYTTPKAGDIQNGSVANTYILSNDLINYYSNAVSGNFNSILFLTEATQNSNSSYEVLTSDVTSNKEFVCLFPVWKAQEYTINISMNINESELGRLLGGNDIDSSFILGLYNKDSVINYSGINSNNLTYGHANGSYNEILANIYFKIYFDKSLETAIFTITFGDNNQNTLTFNLKQLFAVSTGYEFLGWIFDSDRPESLIVKNLLDSQFNRGGSNLINKDGELSFTGLTFDYDLYTKLFYSSYLFDGDTYTKQLSFIENAINSSKTTNIGLAEEIETNRVLSTSFGYIKDNSTAEKYYILYDYKENRLFYKNSNGIKKYIVLYVDEGSGLVTDLTFDYSNLYYKGRIIRFVNENGTYSAYYVENNNVNRISISVRASNVGDIVNGTLTVYTSREFTLYASWKLKQKEITITNGNNSGTENSNNPGLSGYYEIVSTNNNGKVESKYINSEKDSNLKLIYDYYNDLNVNILPYYNGRYISEMTLSFYSIEQYGKGDGDFVYYSTVKYTLTFKFSWNNGNLYVNLESLIMTSEGRDPVTINGTLANNWINVNGSNWNKLSLIDRNMVGTGIINVLDYGDYQPARRLDINRFILDLQNVSSSIEISCKFSIQTFDVNLYNVIDEYGNSLTQRENSPQGVFKTRYEKSVPFDNSEFGSGGPFISTNQADKLNMATVSVDCATNEATYNVPYGYFIYGMFYTSSIYPNRPTDTIENVNQEFGGYDYIYSYGYYNYGKTTTKLEANGDDMYFSQSSGVLGDKSTFAQSVRLSMSFYTFSGWYTSSIDTNGVTVLFTTYGDKEGNYINHNISLYAYYYAENKPTDVIFYVWDDKTMSYIPYNGNSTDYKSNFKSENSAFKTEFVNGENIVKLKDVVTANIVDSDGLAVFQYYLQYGVNATKFNNFDNFYTTEISNSNPSNLTLLNYITRTYWYYEESYYVYYFNYNGNKYYLYYDVDFDSSENGKYNGFYYIGNGGERVYTELYSSDMKNFSIYINGAQIGLSYETRYVYDYDGSKLFVKIVSNEMERYYQMYEVTEEALINKYGSLENVPEFVKSHDPRFYVEIEGEWLYLLQRTDATSANASLIYKENGSEYLGGSITTLDMYYIIYDNIYYEIALGSGKDSGGSTYYNPYVLSNTVTLDINDTSLEYYFNYSNRLLYSNASLSGAGVEFNYVTYCPVNDNYAIGYQNNEANGKWEIQGITLNKLLTPNISFWYGGEYYGFVGYIQVNDSDIATLKLNEDAFEGDSGIVVDSDCELIYSVFKQKINYEFSDEKGYSAIYRERLLNQVGIRVNEYTLESMLSALITVDSYIPNEVTKNLDAVIVRIVVRFDNLEFEDENGNPVQISLSAVVKYKFKMISISSTVLTDNIYAIPIYSQNIVRFTEESITANSGSISFDTEKMELNHFEEFTGSSTHIYNPSFGDYLQFVVLTKEQYSTLMANSGNLADYLNSMIVGGNIVDLISTHDGTNLKPQVTFTPESAGEYYILSFYYKTGTNNGYVNRVSDNVVHYDNTSGFNFDLINIDAGIVKTK